MISFRRIVAYASRGLGALQILLGLSFWTGNLNTLVPLHMLIGLSITALLLMAAVLGARAGAPTARVVLAFAWAALLVWLGYQQTTLLIGDLHWVVRVLHLAVGLAALAQIEGLVNPRRSPGRSSRAATP